MFFRRSDSPSASLSAIVSDPLARV